MARPKSHKENMELNNINNDNDNVMHYIYLYIYNKRKITLFTSSSMLKAVKRGSAVVAIVMKAALKINVNKFEKRKSL